MPPRSPLPRPPSRSRGRGAGAGSRGEAVPDTPHGLDPPWRLGAGLELGAQPADVDRDRRGVGVEGVLPDVVHQLVARERAAGVTGEEQQEVVFARGQRRLGFAQVHAPRRRVNLQLAEAQRWLVLADGVDAAQHRVDARDELGGGEGLDDVVVGAEAQAHDAIGLLALGGEQDDRAGAVLGAYAAHDLEPVEAGEHEVEHDQVRWSLGDRLEGREAVLGHARLVARSLQIARDDFADRRLVVDDEHGSSGVGHRPDCRSGRRSGAGVHRMFRESSAMPTAKSSVARKPSSSRARVASANTWRTSPRRNSPVTWGAGPPSDSAAAISPMLRGVPEQMLNTPGGAVSASRFARATSRTWTKSRSCQPSSNPCGARSAAIALAKIAATPA